MILTNACRGYKILLQSFAVFYKSVRR